MIYKHWKGKYYLKLFTTLSGDNLITKYIHYLPLYLNKNYQIFTRTENNFNEIIITKDYLKINRFTKIL